MRCSCIKVAAAWLLPHPCLADALPRPCPCCREPCRTFPTVSHWESSSGRVPWAGRFGQEGESQQLHRAALPWLGQGLGAEPIYRPSVVVPGVKRSHWRMLAWLRRDAQRNPHNASILKGPTSVNQWARQFLLWNDLEKKKLCEKTSAQQYKFVIG